MVLLEVLIPWSSYSSNMYMRVARKDTLNVVLLSYRTMSMF